MNKLFSFLIIGLIAFTSSAQKVENNYPEDWELFTTIGGIKIEYKYQTCEFEKVKNQVLVLFRYTNMENIDHTMSWTTKEFRNNECSNCEFIDSYEYRREIHLAPNEVKYGDGTSKEDKTLYLFSNFIKLYPGMRDQRLTGFEFIDVNVQ